MLATTFGGSWRRHYNTKRPHGFLGYKSPVPKVFVPAFATPTSARTSLVDKDELLGIEIVLAIEPCLAALQDVRPILLACTGSLFSSLSGK
jgi:hypothetical protein